MKEAFARHAFAAAIVEGIQGVAGIKVVESEFLMKLRALCTEHQALLILDEVQSGFGRSGQFFAHQGAGVAADIITIAKGMGNGFPVAGILIDPRIASSHGLLGTTFGGGQLACAAALAVIEVLHEQSLQNNAAEVGGSLMRALAEVPGVSEVRGRGLMIGFDSMVPAKILRALLLHDHGIITGGGGSSTTVRLLPPLTFSMQQVEILTTSIDTALRQLQAQGAIA
jgi:acetylornithine aminotransferase